MSFFASTAFITHPEPKKKAMKRYRLLQPIEQYVESCNIIDEDHTKHLKECIRNFFATPKITLTHSGTAFQSSVKLLEEYREKRKVTSLQDSSKFIKQFEVFYRKFPQFENSMVCDLVKHVMNRWNGKTNHHLTPALRDMYMVLYQLKPKAADIVAANLEGPSFRNILKAQQSELTEKTYQYNILYMELDDVTKSIVDVVKAKYSASTDTIAVSLSIDASALAPLIQYDPSRGIYVGASYPNHCIPALEKTKEEFERIIADCKDPANVLRIASEVKLAMMVFQDEKPGMTPYKQIFEIGRAHV